MKIEIEKGGVGRGEKEETQTACAMWVKLTPLFPGGLSPCCLWQHGRHTVQGVMGNNPDGDGDRFTAIAANMVLQASDLSPTYRINVTSSNIYWLTSDKSRLYSVYNNSPAAIN